MTTFTLFIVSLIVFILSALGLVVFLSLWVYRDAEVKSEQEPSLWVLAVIFLGQGLGLIIYFLVGRTKKDVPAPGTHKVSVIASAILFVIAMVLFIIATISFATSDHNFGVGPNARMSSGVWSMNRSSYRNNVWTESVRSGRGTSSRTHSLNYEQMRNFSVDSINEEGNLYLQLEQGPNLSRIDISGDFYQTFDLFYEHGFTTGRMRMTLIYERVRNSQTIISWQIP